ncbi:MAG: hypothetical protein IJK64_05990 [Clostridia bacterium]|nr:hypothetical protein [Clostridia bacterium]
MKTIKIKFCDWHPSFDLCNNWITKLLEKHFSLEFSDDPEYIFYSVWGTEHLKYNGIRIFYTAEDISPDFNLCDYAFGFDLISFEDRYLRFSRLISGDRLIPAANKHLFTEEDLAKKTGFCDYVVSNGNGDPIRTEIFYKLSEYKKVDAGGRYLNNIGGRVEDKLDFQSRHKFSIAFENGAQPGYTTEKIVDAFAAKTIPIYWGNPEIAKDFNPGSFVNYWDYGNLDDMIARVIEIDNDDALYRSILATPIFEDGRIPERFRVETAEAFLLHICSQPLDQASRRCRYTWRARYELDRMDWKRIVDKSGKILPRIALKLTK